MIREIFEEMPVISRIFALILIGLVFFLTDGTMSKPEYFSGNVVDKHYFAEGHRIAMTRLERIGVVMGSESEPEKFLLIVKTKNGKVVTAKCEPELYYGKEIGQSMEFAIYKGLFTGISWSVRGVR